MKKFGNMLIGFAFLFGLAIAAPALANDDTIYTSIDAEQLVQILEANDWEVDSSDGNITWYIDDADTRIFIFDGGSSIQFYKYITGVDYSLWELNVWNRDHRFSRTYLDMDGDPVIELDLDLAGGVTEARIVDWLKTCHVSLINWYWAITETEDLK